MHIYTVKITEKNIVHDYLKEYILARGLRGGIIIGIGGLEYAELGYFNPTTRNYHT
ncbi:MAG: hypothetical protein QXJ69_01490 [Desulfurococcaceae archaeon]